MGQIYNIRKGWTSYFLKENNNIAKQRAEICRDCPKAKVGFFESMFKDEIKEIQGLKCSECGCSLVAKLRVKKEKCPLGKW